MVSRPRNVHRANPQPASEASASVQTTAPTESSDGVRKPGGELVVQRSVEPVQGRSEEWRPRVREEVALRLERRRHHHVDGEQREHGHEQEQPVLREPAEDAYASATRASLDPEEGHDQHQRHREQRHGGGGGDLGRLVLKRSLVDVELGHLGGVAGPALAVRHHVDVVEDPGDHRDRLDHDVEEDHISQLRDRDETVHSEEPSTVDPTRLEDVCGYGEEAREEEHDTEAELFPDDHAGHRPERPARLSEPVLREPAQPEGPEQLVDEPVELQQLAEDDADHGNRQDKGEEHCPPVEAPAQQPFEEQHGDEQRERDEHGNSEQQPPVVSERRAKRGIAPGDSEVLERPRRVVAQRRLHELDHRVAEDEHDDGDCRADPQHRFQATRAQQLSPGRARK